MQIVNVGSQLPAVHVTSPGNRKTALRFLRAGLGAGLALLIGMGGLVAHQWVRGETQWLRDRWVMQELTTAVRSMRARAVATRRVVELRVDASHGTFHLVTLQLASQPYEILEQTIWLPDTLMISEAPERLRALPNGRLSLSDIVVTAPYSHRLFRLTTDERGDVRLDEEPLL